MARTKSQSRLRNLNHLADRLDGRLGEVLTKLEQIVLAFEAIKEAAAELPHPYDIDFLADAARRVSAEFDSIRESHDAVREREDDD